jgi:hypothetical protein
VESSGQKSNKTLGSVMIYSLLFAVDCEMSRPISRWKKFGCVTGGRCKMSILWSMQLPSINHTRRYYIRISFSTTNECHPPEELIEEHSVYKSLFLMTNQQ